MLSPAKAITAGALVFAIGGAFLIAQPFQQQTSVPGAEGETTEPVPPAIVTGAQLGVGEPVQEPVDTVVGGVTQGRGSVIAGDQFEADDPRLTGSFSQTVNGDLRMIGDAAVILISPSMRIENDEGAWSGQCDLLVIADGEPDPFACLFSGEGAYDGLSAYLVFENPEQPPNPFKGLIFEGDLPPTPALSSAE
jgi:hypothetical protein